MSAPDPAGVPTRASTLVGATALIILILMVAVILYNERPAAAAARPDGAPPAMPTEVPGFRSDAWYLPDDETLGFVEIPAGPFLMGSDPSVDPAAFDNERWSEVSAQGQLDLPTFYIGRTEVTVAQYAAFVAATNHPADSLSVRGQPDHPVALVSWTDALAYAGWLESQMRASAAAPGALRELLERGWQITLPDEAQWEKAARGADGRVYPWGNAPRNDRANFGSRRTVPVGSIPCPECAYGLADMSGNVWEWTRSPFQPLPFDPTNDRDRLQDDALWVMRGGAFSDAANLTRAAVRGGADPGARRPFIGFRVAITRQ